MAGRKREPNAVKRAKGSHRSDLNHHPKNEPVTDCPLEMPANLKDKEARKHWRELVLMLDEVGLLAGTDADILARYCLAWADYWRARAVGEKEGWQVEGSHGTRNHPAWSMMKDASAEMHRCGSLLGLSPSDRASLGDKGAGRPRKGSLEEWEARKKKRRG